MIQFPYVINPRAGKRSSRPRVRRLPMPQRTQRSYIPPFIESKYFDSLLSAQAIAEATTWTGTELDPATLNTLFAPSQGDDINQRVGRKVSVYKIALRGVIRFTSLADQADVLSNEAVRLILFMDKHTNSAQAQGEQLMAIPATMTSETAFSSFQNLENLGRFRVLKDNIYYPSDVVSGTDGTNTNSLAANAVPFKMTVKFKTPVIVRYNASENNSVADVVDNSFHLLGIKSGASGAHTITYVCRTYYKDG